MQGKYLITTDNWFIAPDGKQYRSAWGDIEIMPDSFLGVKTNVRSSNWYAKVGSDTNHIIIAGCQIHYAVKSDNKPNADLIKEDSVHEGKTVYNERDSRIYIAE